MKVKNKAPNANEELQQYLDLVDWSGICVEDRARECKANGEWFVTEEGRMPEVLAHWLEKQENQEVRSRTADRATNIEEAVEQLNRLGRDEKQAFNRIDAGQQPTLATRGLIEWMTRERQKEAVDLSHPANTGKMRWEIWKGVEKEMHPEWRSLSTLD